MDGNFPSDNADDPKILGMILRHLETQGKGLVELWPSVRYSAILHGSSLHHALVF